MEPFGAAAAVVALFGTALKCYDVLSETEDLGIDNSHFEWQLKTEKRRLIEWGEKWNLKSGPNQKLDPNDDQYPYAIDTLARIISLFASAEVLKTRYGIQASNSSQKSHVEPTSSPSWLSVRITRLRRSRSTDGRTKEETASEALPCLDPSVIRALENPLSLDSKDLVSRLQDEIKRIQDSANKMQKILPLYKKLRWAVVDKARFGELIKKLKEYNDGLEGILPNQPPQNTIPDCPQFLKFHVPLQLPLGRNHHFQGREDLIAEIDAILCPKVGAFASQAAGTNHKRAQKHQIAVLHGLGGMGKSQIAAEYAYRHHSSSSYTSIFWIDATSQTSLSQSAAMMIEQIIAHYQTNLQKYDNKIQHIGSLLGLSGFIKPTGTLSEDVPAASIIKAIKNWLSDQQNKDWLIIFDNNDDIDSVNVYDFLPKLDFGHGSTIITTRRLELKHLGTGVEIDMIEENAAVRILLKSAGKDPDTPGNDEDYAEAKRISERLGYFPLALDQAGGYISAKQIPISNYLTLYTANYARVASKGHRGLTERYRNDTVYTTWKISFESLPKLASELLLLCSFLGGVDISEELLFRGKEAIPSLFEDDSLADDAIDPLLSFSLARRKNDKHSTKLMVSFHPLVLEWARESLDADGRCSYMKIAMCLIGKTYQHDNEGKRTMDEWVFGMRILHHINAAIENFRKLVTLGITWNEETILAQKRIAQHCQSHGLFREAIDIIETFLSSQPPKSAIEKPSIQTVSTMSVLATLYSKNYQNEKALELCKKVATFQEILLGDEHPDTLETKVYLYSVLFRLARYEESLESLEILLPTSEKVLGKGHPTTQEIIRDIADCHMWLDQRGEASTTAHIRYAAAKKETLGNEHPETLNALHNLGWSLYAISNYEESIKICRQVSAVRERVLGREHPDTLNTLHNLANSLHGMERPEESIEIYRQVLAVRERVLGREHLDTLDILHDMTNSLIYLERYEESLEICRRVVAAREKAWGKENLETLSTLHNLADSLHGMKRYEGSVEIYRQVVAVRERVLGKEHPDTLETLSDLSISLRKMGIYEESLEIIREVLAVRERVLESEHPKTIESLQNLANSLYVIKRYEESVEVYRQVIVARERVLGSEHPEILSILHILAHSLYCLGSYEESVEIGRRVVAVRERVLGREHPVTLFTLQNLANSLQCLGSYEESLEIGRRVVAVRERVLGREHPDTLSTLHAIVHSLYFLDSYEESVEIGRRVVTVRERVLGREHPDTLSTLNILAHSLYSLGSYEESAEILTEVKTARGKISSTQEP